MGIIASKMMKLVIIKVEVMTVRYGDHNFKENIHI